VHYAYYLPLTFYFFIIFAPEGIRTTIGKVKGRIIEVVGRVIRNARQIYVKADSKVERFSIFWDKRPY
jgi:hypothetical protein